MQTNITPEKLLKKIEFLFERYSLERRATTQPYLLRMARKKVKNYVYHPGDELVRETLLEHVGSTPFIATTFYPYIKDSGVDLGKALTMLAIHDIGELMTGDEITFTKLASSKNPEHKAALKLLNPYYHEMYEDVETQTSQSAKFAKSIDKITPDILDYLTPVDVTIWRMKHFAKVEPERIIETIIKHKRPYMLWNPFMTEFHIYLIDQLAAKLKKQII